MTSSRRSVGEETLARQVCSERLPEPVSEFRVGAYAVGWVDETGALTGKLQRPSGTKLRTLLDAAGLKDWKFDAAWPEQKIAVEVEGGTFVNGRHSRGAGMAEDCRKYNAATMLGWRVMRYTTDQIKKGHAIADVRKLLAQEK